MNPDTMISRDKLGQHFLDMMQEALQRAAVLARGGQNAEAAALTIEADAYRVAANVTRTVAL